MKKIIYAILTTMLLATGCSESWLDPDPLSFYSPGNTLIDKEGMLSSVTACDRLLREEFVGQHSPILTAMIFSEQCVLGTTDISGPAQNLNEKILPTANNNWGPDKPYVLVLDQRLSRHTLRQYCNNPNRRCDIRIRKRTKQYPGYGIMAQSLPLLPALYVIQ